VGGTSRVRSNGGRRIRVLQFADIVNRHDFIDSIVRRADACDFEVGVCVRTDASNIAVPEYGSDVPNWNLGSTSRRSMLPATYQLARLLRNWRADVLHAHHYDQAIIGYLATRIYRKTRLVIGRHYSDSIYRSTTGVKRQALLRIEQLCNGAAARIVVPSKFIVEILTEWQGVGQSKVDRVPYGFVAEKYAAVDPTEGQLLRDQLGLNGRFVVGTFARLHEEKGHRYLIETIQSIRKSIPNLTALFVGEGPERAALVRQIGEAGLNDVVRLLGWRRDTMALMAAVDVVVQPTLQEAFSQAMVEALWMRKPLVITDVSGAPDIIDQRRNGMLVPKANPAALASAIMELATDQELREQLGEAGRAYVEQNLTAEKIIPRYEQVYRDALAV
jgi:glycosyltransferase involved in cell wall biosynthesis